MRTIQGSVTVLALLALALAPLTATQADHDDAPPTGELVLEGHTVFTVVRAGSPESLASLVPPLVGGAPAASAFAAAPPSLPTQDASLHVHRFPGVLWANDQYLVDPTLETYDGLGLGVRMHSDYGAALAVLVQGDGPDAREPCGGALVAWPSGRDIGDPRWYFYTVAEDLGPLGTALPEMSGDAIYIESYRVTDPTGRTFVTDLYAMRWFDPWSYEIVDIPFWVSNLHGGETFVPDLGPLAADLGAQDCSALADLAEGGVPCDPASLAPRFVDAPCAGYREPSLNGFCYNGAAHDGTGALDDGACGTIPARRYQSLLYLDWSWMLDAYYGLDHCANWWWGGEDDREDWSTWCDPRLDLATNGCQWESAWPCPVGEWEQPAPWQDDLEGNSHAFHPDAAHAHAESVCEPAWGVSPVNHGGSWNGTRGGCDYFHSAAHVQIAHYGAWRPSPPAMRIFAIDDLRGADAPFMDFHDAFKIIG